MVNVLVIGAGGRLGAKIARALVALDARVRVTQRSRPVEIEGATAVAADLDDAGSLARACEGIDVIVSAVQGLRDVIVDGQSRLLRAAEGAGVARMIPSDYSLDFFATAPGGNRNLDLRREFDAALDASRVRGTSVLCGAFMDLIAIGAIGPDRETGAFKAWGDPDQPYDYTHTDDLAAYTAAVALDDGAGRIVRVAGDTKTPRELAAIFGAPLASAGSLDDLTALIDRLRAADPAPADPFPLWQRLMYTRDMASGKGRLAPLDNDRYREIRPRTIRELLATR
jgi:uncharacterized protein YbjT (DUF2867 family)